MANILYRTSNGAYTNIGGVLTPTKEYPSKTTSFPVGLQRSNSYIKGKPLTATEIDTNFYQLAAETNHVAYCDTQANLAAKTVMTTYFPLESGAHVSIRFRHGNTAKNPTLTVKVPNSNDDNNYTSNLGADSGWITYGPFPIYDEKDEQISATNANTQIQLEEGQVYDFFYDDYDLPESAIEDSKTNRVHRWRLKTNGTVHRSGIESIKGFKTFEHGLQIGSESNSYPHLLMSNPNLERGTVPSGNYYNRIIFGDKNLTGVNASNLNLIKVGYASAPFFNSAVGGVYSGHASGGSTTINHTGMVSFDLDTNGRADLMIGFPSALYSPTNQKNTYLEFRTIGEDVRRPQYSMTPWLLRRFDTYDGDGTHNLTVADQVIWSGSARSDTGDGSTTQASNLFGALDATILASGDCITSSSDDIRKMMATPAPTMEECLNNWTAGGTAESIFLVSDGNVYIRPRFGLGNVLHSNAPRVTFDTHYTKPSDDTYVIDVENVSMTGTQFDAITAFASDYPTVASLFPARSVVSNTDWNRLNQ